MSKHTWDLINTSNLNRMIKVRSDIDVDTSFDNLIILKHTYLASEDAQFLDLNRIAFFAAFEENHLSKFENEMLMLASDINDGYIKMYIYCKNSQLAIFKCIDYLKLNPNYQIDFETHIDKQWSKLKELKNIS